MARIFTLIFSSLLLAGCPLDEDNGDLSELSGIWRSDKQDAQEEYLEFSNGNINVLYIVDSLNCSRTIRTYEIAALEPDMFSYNGSNHIVSFDDRYTRYNEDFPEPCGSSLTNQVTVKISFKQLPEHLETYYPSNDEYVRISLLIAFDTDNSGTISTGDVIFALEPYDLGGQKSPTWQTLPASAMLVNYANNQAYSRGAIADLNVSIQENQITLTGKASDFIGIGDISNGTQIDVSSYYNVKAHTQKDRYPNGDSLNNSFLFTSGVDTSLLDDTINDVTVIENDPDASHLNLLPIFDIQNIEVEVTE